MKNKYIYAGFTLPELLAVLIIIAILSSLSLGYYRRSVEQARFSEGLSLANTLVEAVNKAYLMDRIEGATEVKATRRRKIAALDFALPNQKACASASPYCVKTPREFFELQIEKPDVVVVKAYRGTVANPKNYYIQVNPVFGNPKDQVACVGVNTNGKTFCESLGYTNCNGNTCTK